MFELSEPNPDGLQLLYTASNAPEGELLRQVLINEGFAIEFVPSTMGGVGIMGNPCIYVRADQYAEAQEFLREYFNPGEEPEPETPPKDAV